MQGSREEELIRNGVFSLYDLYGHAPAEEPYPGDQKIYNFGRPFLVYHYY